MRSIDLTGQRIGRLTVAERAGARSKQTLWKCKCECGKEIIVMGSNLRNGSTLSCGCLNREKAANRHITHGSTDTRLYRIWHNMKSRCENPRTKDHPDYGGRGITVCPEWRDSFEAFRDWALANGYRDDLTIDRIDNDGPYSPENCGWITNQAQQNNKRNNHIITCFGKSQTLQQWADETGINQSTILARMKRGWSTETSLTEPIRKGEKKMNKKLYIAYGSNLDTKQMRFRCPDAKPIAKSWLFNYQLVFQGNPLGAHANVIPNEGHAVPVVVWEITATDERSLDRYEGVAGGYYTKEYMKIEVNGELREALIYIMAPRNFGIPTDAYLATIANGYQDFNLDTRILNTAVRYSKAKAPATFAPKR